MSLFHILTLYFLSLSFLLLDFVRGKYKLHVYVLFIVFSIFSAGIKDKNTSSDTFNYVVAYETSVDITNFFSIETFFYEPGYTFVQSVFKTFTDDPTYFFLFISFFSVGLCAILIWRYSPLPFFSLFIYISFFYFVREIIIIRYGLACSLMLFAMCELVKKKYNRFFFISVISFLFHYTALSAILFWAFFKFISSKKQIIVVETLLILSIICSVLHVSVLSLIIYVVDYLPPFFAFAINKGLRYLDFESSYGIKQILPLLLYLYIAYLEKKRGLLIKYYLIFVLVIILMLQFNQVVTLARIGQMYFTIIILYIPLLIKNLLLKHNFWMLYSVTILYCLYMFVRMTFFNSGGFINVH